MLQLFRSGFYRLHKNSGVRLIVNSGFCSDSGQKGDDGDKKKPSKQEKPSQKPDVKSTAAHNRLNELLSMMTTESEVHLVKKVQLAKPPGQRKDKGKKQKEDAKKQDSDSDSDSDDEKPKDLVKATKNVATSLGGDAKKTEAELLAKLLGGDSSVVGEPPGTSLSDIITGMQVDKEGTKKGKSVQLTRSKFVRNAIERKGSKGQEYFGMPRERRRSLESAPPTGASVKLFEEEPLNIFKDPAALNESPDILKTWKQLQDRELRLAVTHPPSNYFQKMALWTEQGKLWKFPIDNEQGLDEESKVSFTEHIFLDEHLEPWCPKRGPIRHFMELVCVGLSKNYFITAQEKKEHILWFRDYFEQKKDLLKQVIVQQQDKTNEKKLEQ